MDIPPNSQSDSFIAINPPPTAFNAQPASDVDAPPPFESSQFAIIFRRQRKPRNNPLKSTYTPSRFIHLPNAFEFSGWGEVKRLTLSEKDTAAGDSSMDSLKREKVLGQFTASALAGNAVLGSVFYALPAVVAVGGV